ncbi:hypothetical protein D0865_05029 [Hortaea werneckii]|uniref:Kinesin-like protein KIP2 n=1 Tax=Hortaea werneckii TaxID=91943 RepID=A0A3M7CQC6_HORWE|nr:hypothetical protein D0865_05029 [Hortaea werneckii]
MSGIRRPSTSPLAPPSGPLPALPVPKTRKPLPAVPDSSERRQGSNSSIPLPGSKSPSRSFTSSKLETPAPSKARSTPDVPTVSTTDTSTEQSATTSQSGPSSSGIPTPGKSLRKTTSISAFPLPPKGSPRLPSLPPSPLSTSTSLSDVNAAYNASQKRDSTKERSAESGSKKPKARSSAYGLRARAAEPPTPGLTGTPSLLNGTGDNKLISVSGGSESLLSMPSPPLSRSSSANGSSMTEGTAFEDIGEETSGDKGTSGSLKSPTESKRTSKDSRGNVLVSVRVRPDSGGDGGKGAEGEWMVDGRKSLISYKGKEGGDYRYDSVFSPHDNNSRVYDSAAKRLVRRVMEGYHGTVFAYGMTGTGKTFSMQGTANSPGVIPLAITDIFSYIRENPGREFLLRVSYLEIYNEKIFDLLSQSTPGQVQQEEIKLREDSKRGVYATPLKEEIVQSPNQLLRVIARGDLARRTGSTQFNSRSSRSHAVVQIVVESRERTQNSDPRAEKEGRRGDQILPGGVLVSTLSLIDLAGSEKAAENKERRTEGAHINKSLLTLGTVIARLSGEDEKEDGTKSEVDKEKALKHLPYRDSKLTRLLQPALSGDSLVSILCTIQLSTAGTSAAATISHTGETLNTLKFASRAKNNIVSHAKRNESNPNSGDAGSRALLDRYRTEIQELRAQLDQQNKAKEEAEKEEEIEKDKRMEEQLEREERSRHEEQMLEMQLARTALKERISHLNKLILSSKSLGVNSGRFSSASMPPGRLSAYGTNEFGRPVSVRSRESLRSEDQRYSSNTLEVPVPREGPTVSRTMSSGSITTGVLPAAQVSQLDETSEDDDDNNSGDANGDGDASLAQQNRMLQSDLADKNRYIATLEKRLLQARRTSHSRTSTNFASRASLIEEGGLEAVVREKSREIEELRAKLDDQMRMVTALRSAARKREMVDQRRSTVSQEIARPESAHEAIETVAPHSSRASNRSSTRATNGASHRRDPSAVSRSSSSGVTNYSRRALSPVAILSPSTSAKSEPREGGGDSKAARLPRRRSVDEMTMLLDQMIQEKVESGHVLQGDRGSLRVKRDTVMGKVEKALMAEEGSGADGNFNSQQQQQQQQHPQQERGEGVAI